MPNVSIQHFMLKPKNLIVVLFLLVGFLSGLARQYFAPGQFLSRADIPFALVGLFLIFFWFRLDSDQLGYRRTYVLSVMVLALTVFALPYYFFRSRGFLRGLVATVLFLVIAIAYSMLQSSGEWATYYGLQN